MEALNSQRWKCLPDVTQLLPIHQLKLKVREGEATAPGSCAAPSDGSLPAGFEPASGASAEAKRGLRALPGHAQRQLLRAACLLVNPRNLDITALRVLPWHHARDKTNWQRLLVF